MAKIRKREPINIELFERAWRVRKKPSAKKKRRRPVTKKGERPGIRRSQSNPTLPSNGPAPRVIVLFHDHEKDSKG